MPAGAGWRGRFFHSLPAPSNRSCPAFRLMQALALRRRKADPGRIAGEAGAIWSCRGKAGQTADLATDLAAGPATALRQGSRQQALLQAGLEALPVQAKFFKIF